MANSQIDVALKPDINLVAKTAAGTVTNDVRVVIKTGTTKEEAVVTLQSITAAIMRDAITLE